MSGGPGETTIVGMRGTQDSRGTDRMLSASGASRTPCGAADPELWFAERPAELNLAKALCAHCPIKRACLAGALDRREPWGVWGGEIVQQGVVLAYKRGRGRPSNADRRLGLVTKVADAGGSIGVDRAFGSGPAEESRTGVGAGRRAGVDPELATGAAAEVSAGTYLDEEACAVSVAGRVLNRGRRPVARSITRCDTEEACHSRSA